jgi:hypothetical protein
MRVHPWLKRQYKRVSHPGRYNLAGRHPGFATSKQWTITHHGGAASVRNRANFRTPRWFRNQKNLSFIQDYVLHNGTLGDVIPVFEGPHTWEGGPASSRLTVTNDKISFFVSLDQDGNKFSYDVYRDATSIKDYVNEAPDPTSDAIFEYHEAKMVETQVPQIGLLGDNPIEVELDAKNVSVNEAGEEIEKDKFPWWKNRKVTESTGMIQKDEFLQRFIGDDHPLASYSPLPQTADKLVDFSVQETYVQGNFWNNIYHDLHVNWYMKEIEESLIETIRRTPMEHWWLQEYYSAADWEDFDMNKPLELMYRNRLFEADDPYILLGDIRVKARELMKDDE